MKAATHSTLSTSTWLPTKRLLSLRHPPQTQMRPMRTRMRRAAKMRQTSTATDIHEEGKEGEDSRTVHAVAERHDAAQLAKGSEKLVDRDRVNAVVVDEVPPASHILCRPTSSSRIPSSQVTSPRTQPLLNSCSSNSHSSSSSNSQCSNSSPNMIDTAHHPQPAAHAANKNSTSNNSNSNSQQASAKAVGRGEEGSKDIRWPMRSSKRTLRPRKTSPAPSSSISQMKAARSHFLSGVAMVRVKSARAARNARKSGSLNAHPAS